MISLSSSLSTIEILSN